MKKFLYKLISSNPGVCQTRFKSETTAVTACLVGTVLVVEKIK